MNVTHTPHYECNTHTHLTHTRPSPTHPHTHTPPPHPPQLPAALRPVAVVYKGLSGLKLGGCTLARILRGDINTWNAQAIRVSRHARIVVSRILSYCECDEELNSEFMRS